MSIKSKIIEHIKRNKISTTEVADILGKKGLVKGPKILNKSIHKVGEVSFVYAFNNSNWEVQEQLKSLKPNKIVYVHQIEFTDKAVFGDLLTKYIMLYKNSIAIVCNGLLRDAHNLVKERYPIWCNGVTPIGAVNSKNETSPDLDYLKSLQDKYHGSIMVCDDSGVVMIEKDKINERTLELLKLIELQEDVWYLCLDTYKMSTYEIVCQKKYLNDDFNGISEQKKNDLKKFADLKFK